MEIKSISKQDFLISPNPIPHTISMLCILSTLCTRLASVCFVYYTVLYQTSHCTVPLSQPNPTQPNALKAQYNTLPVIHISTLLCSTLLCSIYTHPSTHLPIYPSSHLPIYPSSHPSIYSIQSLSYHIIPYHTIPYHIMYVSVRCWKNDDLIDR